jgi:rare lipoprotein A
MTGARHYARSRNIALILMAGASLAACATSHSRLASQTPAGAGRYKVGAPYQVAGVWYVPQEQPHYNETGVASWYGDAFHMKPTANGEIFDMNGLSAAHTTLPLPSIVEVTNLDNGKKIQVRVNDRGPFVGGRIIDLSHEAARELGYDRKGLANVRVRYVGPAPLGVDPPDRRYASAAPSVTSSYVAPATVSSANRGTMDQNLAMAAGLPASAPPKATATVWPTPAWAGAAADGPAYIVPPPTTVSSSALAPIGAAASPPAPTAYASMAYAPNPYVAAPPVTSGGYRIQAGAFSDPGNAQRVASQLSVAGRATVEPIQRGDATLYRVMLQSGDDEGEAWALRDRVASYGFAEARVVRPF